MALFNLDIERYYHSKKEKGYEVRSIAYIQYPIYCVHATILDSTPDPLENLDKAIVKSLDKIEGLTTLEIAQILSVQKRGIDLRVDKMISEGFINGKTNFSVTELGANVLIEGSAKRIQRRQYNFYIDGIDFKPLPKELYSFKYLKSFLNENEYTYYTNSHGETRTFKPFKPNIIHEPLVKEMVVENILEIEEKDRENSAIPLGLEEIENIDFTKMTVPILVALMVKEGKPHRELVDGFSVLGDPENILSFLPKLEEKINKLELRLDTWQKNENDLTKFSFTSNWVEIDKKYDEGKLQFVQNEDLKIALRKLYKVNIAKEEELINTDFEIGVNVTEDLLMNLEFNRLQLLRNLERGRDYQMTSLKNAIWLVYSSFRTNSSFVKTLLEIKEVLNNARSRKLDLARIEEKLVDYEIHRKALVILEEYDLLEKIDMKKHMQINY